MANSLSEERGRNILFVSVDPVAERADLLVLDANPPAKISNIRSVRFVIKDGEMVENAAEQHRPSHQRPHSCSATRRTPTCATGRIDSALADARRAFETDSNNLATLLFSASVYLAMQRPREAHALASCWSAWVSGLICRSSASVRHQSA